MTLDPLTAFLKGAESMETNETTSVGNTPSPEVYPDETGVPEPSTEPIQFSDTAQSASRDGRQGVSERLLASTSSTQAVGRALIGAVLDTSDFETGALSIRPVEKVSHPRAQTLLEQTIGKLGRL